jgi:uncharacterized protein (TIGR03435 family)
MTLLVKATVVIALALLAVKLARRSSAAVRHLMLSGAFAVLLLLPLASMVVPPVQFDVPVAPLASTVIWSDSADEAVVVAPSPAVPRAAGVQTAPGVDPATRGPATARLLSLVWAAGTLAFLAPVIVGLYRVSRLRRGGQTWPEGRRVVAALAHEAGGRRAVDVRLHDAVPGPVTCGLVRPVILLPADACTWSEGDLHRAVLHELEHVARADWAGQCAARIACAIYWFHPLVWMAWRELALEAERACDDAVLRRAEPDDYASQLVGLARRLEAASHPPLPAMARSRDLPTRVRAVLDHAQARGRAGTARLAVAAAVVMLTVAAIAPLRAVAQPQSAALVADDGDPASLPSFEVASIRRNTSGEEERFFQRQPGGRFNVRNMPLRALITFAYDLQGFQLQGGPDWITADRFDIVAKAEGDPEPVSLGSPGGDPLRLMLRSLLAERFNLVMHEETRELPIFELVVARRDGTLGPQLRPASVDCNEEAAARRAAERAGAPPRAGVAPNGPGTCGLTMNPVRIAFGGMPLSALTGGLAGMVGRVVVDRTGLTGNWEFELKFAPDPARLPPGIDLPPIDDTLPSLFTALEEQLGLKLEPSRGPVEVMVIDSVEQPEEN